MPELPPDVVEGLTAMFVDKHGRDPTRAEVAEWAAALNEGDLNEATDGPEAANEDSGGPASCCCLCAKHSRVYAAPETAAAIATGVHAATGTAPTITPTGDVLMQNKVIVVARRPYAVKPFLWIHECTLVHSSLSRTCSGCSWWSRRLERTRKMIPLQHITSIELQFVKKHEPLYLLLGVAIACYSAFQWFEQDILDDMEEKTGLTRCARTPLLLQSFGVCFAKPSVPFNA